MLHLHQPATAPPQGSRRPRGSRHGYGLPPLPPSQVARLPRPDGPGQALGGMRQGQHPEGGCCRGSGCLAHHIVRVWAFRFYATYIHPIYLFPSSSRNPAASSLRVARRPHASPPPDSSGWLSGPLSAASEGRLPRSCGAVNYFFSRVQPIDTAGDYWLSTLLKEKSLRAGATSGTLHTGTGRRQCYDSGRVDDLG